MWGIPAFWRCQWSTSATVLKIFGADLRPKGIAWGQYRLGFPILPLEGGGLVGVPESSGRLLQYQFLLGANPALTGRQCLLRRPLMCKLRSRGVGQCHH